MTTYFKIFLSMVFVSVMNGFFSGTQWMDILTLCYGGACTLLVHAWMEGRLFKKTNYQRLLDKNAALEWELKTLVDMMLKAQDLEALKATTRMNYPEK